MKQRRLDDVLTSGGFAEGKEAAFILVTEGRVFVNGQKAVSPAQLVSDDERIEVRSEREFVGRGAYKLEAAIREWGIDVSGKVCVDVGAATGGFTEVLLKHGAKKVYAIDVGHGKLDLKLREDPRVVVMEGMNVLTLGPADAFFDTLAPPSRGASLRARQAAPDGPSGDHAGSPREGPKRHPAGPTPSLKEKVDMVTIDVSFTSLRSVLPVVRQWLSAEGKVVALFKPQYEVKDTSFLKHGILRDDETRRELVERFRAWLREHGWQEFGFMESPIRGSEGNVEYLFYLRPV